MINHNVSQTEADENDVILNKITCVETTNLRDYIRLRR